MTDPLRVVRTLVRPSPRVVRVVTHGPQGPPGPAGSGVLSVGLDQYIPAPDGTIDNYAALVQATTDNPSKAFWVPPGEYRFSFADASRLLTFSEQQTFHGYNGKTIFNFDLTGVTGTRKALALKVNGLRFRDITFKFTGVTGTGILGDLGGGADLCEFEHCTFDFGVSAPLVGGIPTGTPNWIGHGFLPTLGDDFYRLAFRWCLFRNYSRVYFRQGVAGDDGTISGIEFDDCTFEDGYRAAISTNSPLGLTEDVKITRNRFGDNFAKTTSGSDTYDVGVGSSKKVRVSNNEKKGKGDFIHAEESVEDLSITDNQAELSDTNAFHTRWTDNNFGGAGYVSPKRISVIGNKAKGPGKSTSTNPAFQEVNDSSGQPPAVSITIALNTAEDFKRGYQLNQQLTGESVICAHNQAISCQTGIFSPRPVVSCKFNMLVSCNVGLESQFGGMWGEGHHFRDVGTPAFCASSSTYGPVTLKGWEVIVQDVDLPANTVTNISVILLGLSLNGTLTFRWHWGEVAYRGGRRDLDYDGSTLVEVDRRTEGSGVVVLRSAPNGVVAESSILKLAFNNTSLTDDYNNGYLTVTFEGAHDF